MRAKKSSSKKVTSINKDKVTKGAVFKNVLLIVAAVVIYSVTTDFLINDLIVGRWLNLYDRLGEGPAMLMSYIISASRLIGMTFLLKKKQILSFSWKGLGKGLHIGLVLLIYACIAGIMGVYNSLASGMGWASPSHIITMTLAIVFGVGVTEELLFRGLVQNLLFDIFGRKTRKSVTIAVIVTGALFGAWHLLNINAEGANWSYVAMQALSVSGIGMVLAAIYARNGSIWAVALIHGLWDFGLMVTNAWFVTDAELLPFSTMEDVPVVLALLLSTIPCSLYVVYSMFLLRDKKKKEYLAR